MLIDTRVIDNFLSDEEISEIEKVATDPAAWTYKNYHPGNDKELAGELQVIDFDYPHCQRAKEILMPKLQSQFHPDIQVDSCHILNSYIPYGIHTDVILQTPLTNTYAWTLVIPVGEYDCSTISFNEEAADCKGIYEWVDKYDPDRKNEISEEFFNQYLSHDCRDAASYLSIDAVFKWKKGTAFANSRAKFHCSNNFRADGLTVKRAIIIWTSIKQN